jgi:hypothetical protein
MFDRSSTRSKSLLEKSTTSWKISKNGKKALMKYFKSLKTKFKGVLRLQFVHEVNEFTFADYVVKSGL